MPPSLTLDQQARLALHLVPGLGPRLTTALLERFGDAATVLRASVLELCEVPRISPRIAELIRAAMSASNIAAEMRLLEERGVTLLFRDDDAFPAELRNIPDPPHQLYIRGQILPVDASAVGIVGSRHCTSYGIRIAERLARDLAQAGCTIVSGLARGIDGAAHRGAMQAGGRTLAVLAGGLAKIYPPEHDKLADEVVGAGALLTESNMRMESMAGMFPARNRIISGLSRAIVIVEANEKSGALITATHAAEQGRDVYAVPGPVDSAASAGALELLRKGARLVRHAGDVLEELRGVSAQAAPRRGGAPATPAVPAPPPVGLDGPQARLWAALASGARQFDELVRELEIGVPELMQHLLLLEMKKLIRRLPGNRYERM